MRALLLIALTTLFMTTSFAKDKSRGGDEKGNGGGAVVCRTDSKITYAQMYDNWEYSKDLGVKESNAIDEKILLATIFSKLRKANLWFARDLEREVTFVRDRIQNFFRVFGNVKINKLPKNESNIKMMPINCPNGTNAKVKYEQVVNYVDNDVTKGINIYVNKTIFDKFSQASRVSLYLHEATYKLLRRYYGHSSSERARKLSAYLIAWGTNKITDSRMHNVLRELFNRNGRTRSYYEALGQYSAKYIRRKVLVSNLGQATKKGQVELMNQLIAKRIVVNGDIYRTLDKENSNAIKAYRENYLNKVLIKLATKGKAKEMNQLIARRVVIGNVTVTVSKKIEDKARSEYLKINMVTPLNKFASEGRWQEVKRYLLMKVLIGNKYVVVSKDDKEEAKRVFRKKRLITPIMKAINSKNIKVFTKLLTTSYPTFLGSVELTSKEIGEVFAKLTSKYLDLWEKYQNYIIYDKKGYSRLWATQRILKRRKRKIFRNQNIEAKTLIKMAKVILTRASQRFNATLSAYNFRFGDRNDLFVGSANIDSIPCNILYSYRDDVGENQTRFCEAGQSYKNDLIGADFRFTPLMFASLSGNIEFAKLLLARADVKNNLYETISKNVIKTATALRYAKNGFNRSRKMQKLLKRHGLKHQYWVTDCYKYFEIREANLKLKLETNAEWYPLIAIFSFGGGAIPLLAIHLNEKLHLRRIKKTMKYIKVSRKLIKADNEVTVEDLTNKFKKDYLSHKRLRWKLHGETLEKKAKTLANIIVRNSANGKLCSKKRPFSARKIRKLIRKNRLK